MNTLRIVARLSKPLNTLTSTLTVRHLCIVHSSVLNRIENNHGSDRWFGNRELCNVKTPTTWSVCYYAKKAGKDKKDKKGKTAKVELTQEEIGNVINLDEVRQGMTGVLDRLKDNYIHSLNIRTSTGSFDKVVVETADGRFHLNQLGQIVQKNPQLLMINLAGVPPQYIKDVKDALMNSGLNVNPDIQGTTIFIPIPRVTREHRESLAKNAKKLFDQSKVKLNELYQKHLKSIKNSSKTQKLSEDLVQNLNKTVLDILHEHTAEAEKMLELKKKELLGD